MGNHNLTYQTSKTGEQMRHCAERDKAAGKVDLRFNGDHMIESNERGSAVCPCHGELCKGTKHSFLKMLMRIGVITSIASALLLAIATHPAEFGWAIAQFK